MKRLIFIFSFVLMMSMAVCGFAAEGVLDSNGAQDIAGMIASDYDIARLKNDFASNKLAVGKTRLKDISKFQGEPRTVVTDTEKKLSYDYNGEIKIDFKKEKYLRRWEYDGFKDPVYTDDVDDLRYDLESKTKLVGQAIAYSVVRKDYDEPTESHPTEKDGGKSVYYYGNIKMIFENVIVVTKYVIKDVKNIEPEGVYQTK